MESDALIQKAISAYLSGDSKEVYACCRAGFKIYPDDQTFFLLCGMTALREGDLDAAEEYLKNGLSLNKHSALLQETLAELYGRRNNQAAGAVCLQNALVMDHLVSRQYSQGGEDYLISQILTEKTGCYVDVGAHDPVSLSNTYFFYRRGWTGICLEPDQGLAEKFKAVRPKDIVVTAAASNYTGKGLFYQAKASVNSSLAKTSASSENAVEVDVCRLEDLLKKYNVQGDAIDFMSIDTEGTEIDVLEGLNCNYYRPRLFVLEYVSPQGTNPAMFPYLSSYGYYPVYIGRWNVIFSREFEKDTATLHRFLINKRLCLLGAQKIA